MAGPSAQANEGEAKGKSAASQEVDPAESPFIQELLQRSRSNKEKYDKERLDSYYRRNYLDYFNFVDGGSDRGTSQETKDKVKKWLEQNR